MLGRKSTSAVFIRLGNESSTPFGKMRSHESIHRGGAFTIQFPSASLLKMKYNPKDPGNIGIEQAGLIGDAMTLSRKLPGLIQKNPRKVFGWFKVLHDRFQKLEERKNLPIQCSEEEVISYNVRRGRKS